jgi:DNA processing protein
VVSEFSPEDRRRLSDRFRKQLNLNEIHDGQINGETKDAAEPSVLSEPGKAVTRAVLAVLTPDVPVSLDHLVDHLGETTPGCSPSEIIAVLFDLEMSGLIRQLPGKNFLKVWAG